MEKKRTSFLTTCPVGDPTSTDEDGTAAARRREAKESMGVVGATITVVNPAVNNGYPGGNAWTIAEIIAEKTRRKTSPVRRIVDRMKEEEKQHEKNRATS